MLAKEQKTLFRKYINVTAIFFYLKLLLWSVLLRPAMDIDVRWVPKSFFSSARQTTCIVRMHQVPMGLFEATFFSALAVFGYFCGCGGVAGVGRAIYGTTLDSFEQALMGARQKFYWFCLVPWIITFVKNWLENVGKFLLLFSGREVYEAHNVYSSMFLMLAYFAVQALLASEVMHMALLGWCVMKNINDENVVWEQRKRLFNGDTLHTVFGVTN